MKAIKAALEKAGTTIDWNEIAKGIKEATGDELDLSDIPQHFHFHTWDELETFIIEITGEAWLNCQRQMHDENSPRYGKWCSEFIEQIKP